MLVYQRVSYIYLWSLSLGKIKDDFPLPHKVGRAAMPGRARRQRLRPARRAAHGAAWFGDLHQEPAKTMVYGRYNHSLMIVIDNNHSYSY